MARIWKEIMLTKLIHFITPSTAILNIKSLIILLKREPMANESIPILEVCPHPLTPSIFWGEGLRVRAEKLGCTLTN